MGSSGDESHGSQEGLPISEEKFASRSNINEPQEVPGKAESEGGMTQTQKEFFAQPLRTLKEEGGSSQLEEVMHFHSLFLL